MSVTDFLKSVIFRKHLILAFAMVIAAIWFSLRILDLYTLHGRYIVVPDLEGMTPEEAKKELRRSNLKLVINDSIFDSDRVRGTIASQNPAPGQEVKRNRSIYMTVVAMLPEMVAMPDLTDLSLRQAIAILENYGLKTGRLEHVPSIARNAVLRQRFNNRDIEPGTLIESGTAIDLVLGSGVADNVVPVPLLIGKSRDEAIQILNLASLNIGQETFLDEDETNVRVYRQTPNPSGRRAVISQGGTVDLFYRSESEFDFDAHLEQTLSIATPDLFGKSPEEVFVILQDLNLEVGNEVFERNVSRQNARVFRQQPDISNSATIIKGSKIDIWYRDANEFN